MEVFTSIVLYYIIIQKRKTKNFITNIFMNLKSSLNAIVTIKHKINVQLNNLYNVLLGLYQI